MTDSNLMMAVLSMAAYENDHRDVGLATNLKAIVPASANAVEFCNYGDSAFYFFLVAKF